jgi:hypothetical protein
MKKKLCHFPENNSYQVEASNVSPNKSSNSAVSCLVKLAKLAGYLLVIKEKTNLSLLRTRKSLARTLQALL